MTEGKKDNNQQQISVLPILPRFYAQKCPTCNGFGTLKYGQIVCIGCKGKTWVLIPTGLDRQIENEIKK